MEGIGKGFAQAFLIVIIVAFLVGGSFMGVVWVIIGVNSNDIESTEKVLYPTDYRIEVNDKKIDTIYIYNEE